MNEGTEYYYNGNIEFEGEHLNGKRKNGKEYNEYNYEKFEGEYLNGKIWNGNIDFLYDTCFEGKYFMGKKWNGKEVINSLNQIDNEYLNGEVIKTKEYGKYTLIEYDRKDLPPETKGKFKESDNEGNLIFEGEYLNDDIWNGKGKIYIWMDKGQDIFHNLNFDKKDTLIFEGEIFKRKKWNGKIYDIENNNIYELKEGKGYVKEYDETNGSLLFKGNYLNGKRSGKGKEFDSDGKLIFEGEYLNGERNGFGEEYDRDGNIIFKGEYFEDERNGSGVEYDNKGNIIFEGTYFDGKIWDGLVK